MLTIKKDLTISLIRDRNTYKNIRNLNEHLV